MAVKMPSRALKKECGSILESMKVSVSISWLELCDFHIITSLCIEVTYLFSLDRHLAPRVIRCDSVFDLFVCFAAAMERVGDDVRERRLLGQGCLGLHPG